MYYQKERNMIIFDADRPKDSPFLDSQGELTGRSSQQIPGNEI
jgi:hypothetical protein